MQMLVSVKRIMLDARTYLASFPSCSTSTAARLVIPPHTWTKTRSPTGKLQTPWSQVCISVFFLNFLTP
jgi:hypothetical protein